jgi:elongation factor G
MCLAGQRGCGKTTLADAVAFNTGVNNRIGRVDDGSSILDYSEGEIARKTSISAKLLACEWKGSKINLLDCPGHSDFVGELLSSIKVADAVGILIDAVAGVEIGTQIQWRFMEDYSAARFFFVNKLEKENANWKTAVESIQSAFGNKAVALQMPIGQAESFKGVVDLLRMKACSFDAGGKQSSIDVPADLREEAEAARESLIEMAAEADDALLEKFFEDGSLSDEDMIRGLRIGISGGKLFPVLFGAAGSGFGVQALLDFVVEFLPSPNDMPATKAVPMGSGDPVEISADRDGKPIAFVFKTVSEGHLGDMSFFKVISGNIKPGLDLVNQQTGAGERIAHIYSFQGKNRIDLTSVTAGDVGVAVKLKGTHTGNTLAPKGLSAGIPEVNYPNPVMDVAVQAKKRGEEDKIASGLHKLFEEDPTFKLIPDPALKQQVLWGQGSTHIEVLAEKLKKRFGVEADLVRPKIPYRETVRGKVEQQYKHKKQSGGRGQYGEVYIRIEPHGRGNGFEFSNEISGGVIPSKFIPAVEKGIVEQMHTGGLCGAQVVDVKVALYFGSFHDVDSSDMAFKIAGSMAFREGFTQAKPVILEPIYNLEIMVPDDFTGDVMGDLSSRRGKIAGMDPEGRNQRIRASVPQAELYQYSVDLRSMTQGQGVYAMEFSRYEEVPQDVSQKIMEAARKAKEEDA